MKTGIYAFVALLVVVGFIYLNLPQFTVQELAFAGNTTVTEEELAVFSAFEPGNVFRKDPQRIAQAVQTHPWVRDANTRWDWPNSITIVVEERTPVALVPRSEIWYILDREGEILPRPLTMQLPNLPIAVGLDLEDNQARSETAVVLRDVPDAIGTILSEWNPQEARFITHAGVQVFVGDITDMQRKYRVLDILLDEIARDGRQAISIDLRSPAAPVVLFR